MIVYILVSTLLQHVEELSHSQEGGQFIATLCESVKGNVSSEEALKNTRRRRGGTDTYFLGSMCAVMCELHASKWIQCRKQSLVIAITCSYVTRHSHLILHLFSLLMDAQSMKHTVYSDIAIVRFRQHNVLWLFTDSDC